jgi:acylphosphatase
MLWEITLSGRVQGVGCRYYCAQSAKRLGLRGAASNNPDGTVQLLVKGSEDDARTLAAALLENNMGLHFYGRITSADISPFDGPLDGDYAW